MLHIELSVQKVTEIFFETCLCLQNSLGYCRAQLQIDNTKEVISS